MRSSLAFPPVMVTSQLQWKAFWDTTGGQWGSGDIMANTPVSSSRPVPQVVDKRALSLPLCLPWHTTEVSGVPINGPLAVLEIRFCTKLYTNIHSSHLRPLGYAKTFPQLTNVSEVRGGSPWGAGTFAVSKPRKALHKPTNLLRALTDPAHLRPSSSSSLLSRARPSASTS